MSNKNVAVDETTDLHCVHCSSRDDFPVVVAHRILISRGFHSIYKHCLSCGLLTQLEVNLTDPK